MPRSVSYSILGALVAIAAYLALVPSPRTTQDLVAVAITGFNVMALVGLFKLFYELESATNAAFGKAVRENLGTIVPAMIISLIFAVSTLVGAFL